MGVRGALYLGDLDQLERQAGNLIRQKEIDWKAVRKETLREVFREAVRGIQAGKIRHGVMFEVPSACLGAEEILEVADFGSIGTKWRWEPGLPEAPRVARVMPW